MSWSDPRAAFLELLEGDSYERLDHFIGFGNADSLVHDEEVMAAVLRFFERRLEEFEQVDMLLPMYETADPEESLNMVRDKLSKLFPGVMKMYRLEIRDRLAEFGGF